MKVLIQLIVLTVIISACQSTAGKAGSNASFDLTAVQSHIHEMNKSYGERFRHDDMEFYQQRYCRDIIIMPEQCHRSRV